MNTDFRLAIDFWQHPKTKKLIRRAGLEGVRSLQILWAWAAYNRPNGSFAGMDKEDIELAADWNGDAGTFVKALDELRWLDNTENGYALHDWQEHNPWAADAEARGDKARLSRLRQVNPAAYEQCVAKGKTAISQREYEELKKTNGERQRNASETPADCQQQPSVAPAPSPSPSPSPVPKELTMSNDISYGSAEPCDGDGKDDDLKCPQTELYAIYEEMLPELPKLPELRESTKRNVRARWKEKLKKGKFSTKDGGIVYFRGLFAYIKTVDWVMGRSKGSTWRCDYDWIMQAKHFDRITSGYYERPTI